MYQVMFNIYQNIKSCLFYDGKNSEYFQSEIGSVYQVMFEDCHKDSIICIQDDKQFHKNIQPAIKFIRNRIQSRNISMYEKVFQII
jgi:hypothetical protein